MKRMLDVRQQGARPSAEHPPWLRFHAYGVGLPKTGTTSLAAMFGHYRTAHEWELDSLSVAGVRRIGGASDDAGLWRESQGRLDPVRLELDVATSHHLYADVLRDRYPQARFIVTYRDVRGWVNSLLDLTVMRRRSHGGQPVPDRPWCGSWARWASAGKITFESRCARDDSEALPALMQTWAEHLRVLREQLPAERTLWVRTTDIESRVADIAAFVTVPFDTLRLDQAHANRTAVTLDRFTIADRSVLARVDEVYQRECADLMAGHFPEEHARFAVRNPQDAESAWRDYVERVDASLSVRHREAVAVSGRG